jgi:hypothetical protein
MSVVLLHSKENVERAKEIGKFRDIIKVTQDNVSIQVSFSIF